MPLHLTKIAFGVTSLDAFAERWRTRAAEGEIFELGTRYLPKRHVEIAGQGSLYWIFKHMLVARSPIVGFGEGEGGRATIRLGTELRLVHARPRRAHQGWRYLEDADAPPDLASGESAELPPALTGKLAELGLV